MCALPPPHAVFCWGSNQFGQASHGSMDEWQPEQCARQACLALLPSPCMRHRRPCPATFTDHRHCLTATLQCGTGQANARVVRPTPVLPPLGAASLLFDQVKAGDRFTCVHSTVGELFCFGGATAEDGRESSLFELFCYKILFLLTSELCFSRAGRGVP